MMIVTATEASMAALLDNPADLAALLEFHDAMLRAGVVASVEALLPARRGVHVHYASDRRAVVDSPFLASTPHIAGFWLIQVNSVEEAIEWARRVPLAEGEVEVRQTAFQLLPVD